MLPQSTSMICQILLQLWQQLKPESNDSFLDPFYIQVWSIEKGNCLGIKRCINMP